MELWNLFFSPFYSRFWIFLETAWWQFMSRQATHTFEPIFLGFTMNRLAAGGDPPGDVYCAA